MPSLGSCRISSDPPRQPCDSVPATLSPMMFGSCWPLVPEITLQLATQVDMLMPTGWRRLNLQSDYDTTTASLRNAVAKQEYEDGEALVEQCSDTLTKHGKMGSNRFKVNFQYFFKGAKTRSV